MDNYKTAEEIAVDWNISARHIQHLCRTGKIEGAIKRAGSWFIPGNTPIPVKNTKSSHRGFKFIGTKEKIFDSAIELFMSNGFNDVSLRDIADKVGIQQSTIYNHFKSKQEILDTIYDFYCYHHLKNRPSFEEMDTVMDNHSLGEVINRIRYDYGEEYAQKMSHITKIIFQRLSIDDRAREIGKSLIVDEGIRYVEEVFNRGIESGRLEPFDTHLMAIFVNSVRIFTLFNWLLAPSMDEMMKLLNDENALYERSISFIKELRPPNDSG